MAVTEDTPVTLPGHRRAESVGLELVDPATPEPIPFEETGRVSSALYAAVEGTPEMTPENFLEELAQKIFEKGGGGGGGSDGEDPGAKTLKEIKRHKWLAALMSLLLGSGGMVGSYYALKARAASNTHEVEAIKTTTKAAKISIDQNTDDIRVIKVEVGGTNKAVGEMKTQQTVIAEGIESLKQENVNRLERELEKAEREIRRRDRLDLDR